MKTSLVSTAASVLVKADPAPQLKSVAVYFRGRKMVLMQRPQRRLSLLLCRMLRRSMLNLLGRLPTKLAAPLVVPIRRILSAGALCVMALASVTTAHATAVTDTTLPTDYSVKYGQVGVSTTGNQMNVAIGTDKAIINWNSFSIGSQAGVDFHFNNATSASSVLNRVTGNDPSQIMGSLTSNGKVFLINAAGILVGKTAKIDVAGFTASTLNLHNTDFLNDKLSFHGNPNSTAGVVIEQDGSIKTKDGGSVYLIGASVENNGVITSPGGEVLLAAGSSVDLVDTGTPGVKIVVKGDKGKVTNLGKIIAATGTIGFGAALINNGGVINASSVDKAGGRIFLRASQDLTTTETSTINADGTVGGNVVLYADNTADIGGDVSALGSAGKGGYVDTSGKMSLAVKYAPRVGAGGEWFIDPSNVDIVASGTSTDQNVGGVITATGDSSTISASVIETALNGGTNITIATGSDNSTSSQAGDISVSTSITKSGGGAATLTLTAAHNITIYDNGGITDGSDGIVNGGLSLVLNAGNQIQNVGGITLGGNLTANSVSFDNGKNLFLGGGTATFSSDLVNNFNGTIAGTGTFNMGSHTLVNNAGIVKPGYASSTGGTLTVNGNYQQNSGGTLEVKLDRSGANGPLISDQLNVTGNVNLSGTLKVDPQTNYTNAVAASSIDKVAFMNYGGGRGASFFTTFSGLPSTLFVNYILPISGSGHDISMAYAPAGSTYFSGAGGTLNWNDANNWSGGAAPVTSSSVYMDVGSVNNVTSLAVARAIENLTIASGKLTTDANLTVNNDTLLNNGTLDIGSGAFNTTTLHVAAGGTAQISGGTAQVSDATSVNGTLNLTTGGSLTTLGLGVGLGGTMHVSNGTAHVTGTTSVSGTLTVDGTGILNLDDTLSGSGSLVIGNAATDSATVTMQAIEGGSSIDHLTMKRGGTLNANASFSTGDLNMTGGTVIAVASRSFFVSGNFAQTGGTITINGSGNFRQLSGDLVLGTINGTGDLTLRSDTGAITQRTGGTLTTNSLNATAMHGIALTNTGNNVSAFTAMNGGMVEGQTTGVLLIDTNASGNIALTNSNSAGLTLGGTIKNEAASNGATDGNIAIINTGDITEVPQTDGPMILNGIFAANKVALTSTAGNVTLAKVVATDLAVSAAQGAIKSDESWVSLKVSGTMTATAKTGITLNSNTNVTVLNSIANFSGTNTGAGDITVYNQSSGDTVNNLVQISNSGGNVLVDNMGAMKTTGAISATGAVSLATHSPLTIGAGGISAGNGVTLAAGDGTSTTDALVLNGAIRTVIGNLTFGGNSVAANAPVFGPNAPVFNSTTPVVFSSNYAVNPVTVTTPVTTPPVVVTTTTVDQNVASTTHNVNTVTETTPVTTNQPSALNSASSQTAGGGDGEFGGTKDDGKGGKGEKSSKPLPICS